MLPSGLVDIDIDPQLKEVRATFLVNLPGGIIEAYDKNRKLLAVFSHEKNSIYKKSSLDGYTPYMNQAIDPAVPRL